MTLQDVITQCDDLKPNQFTALQKLKWINQVESKIWKEIIINREIPLDDDGNPTLTLNEYKEEDMDIQLLAADYSELYLYYLMSMVDLFNEETSRYNVSMSMFNEAYRGFADQWYREHGPARGSAPINL